MTIQPPRTSDAELTRLIGDIAKAHQEPDAGQLPECWATLVDLGLPLVGIPQEQGGSGGSLPDLLVLARALGRHGISTPLLEASVASWVLAANGQQPTTDLATITLDPQAPVPWARHAALLVVCARDPIGVAGLRAATVQIHHQLSVAGEPWDIVDLTAMPATVLSAGPSADQVRARMGALRAAALTGAVEGAYELTRSYVSTRHQFGKPLIRIQAVAANLAQIKTALVQCEAALARAEDEQLSSAAAARVLAGQAATETARLAHQLHGAIGITEEYPLHRFTERLWAWRDADLDQRSWSVLLGGLAARGGEAVLWEQLTPW
jgi:acyl-CoA dehydrogenase